jgi:hypothetical protein
MPRFDFSQNIPKMVPASKLDEIEENMLNCFNNKNNKEDVIDDNLTDYNGSGDEIEEDNNDGVSDDDLDFLGNMNNDNFNTFCNVLDQKINEKEKNENKTFSQNNILQVDTSYDEIDTIEDKLIKIKKENMDEQDVYTELHNKYDFTYWDRKEIGDKLGNINIAYKLGYNELVRNTTMNIFEKIANDFDINYDYISLKENNNIYVLHNKEKEVENVNILDNDKNIFPKLNKLDENKNNKYYIKKKYNIDIDDIKVNFISFRTNWIKYKKKSINYKNKLKKEQIFCVEFKNNITNILKDIKELEKGYDEILEMEKMDQLKKLYIKLSQNIEKKQNINDNNNIYNLFNKLDNQKVDKLYILADIGKELKEQNIEDENKFLDTFKNKELYYIYDLKNKNKISRFINMCNKLCLLKDKINLASIINNNLLTSIRDLSQNNFMYLLNLF